MSVVQIRGSIPLFWGQQTNARYDSFTLYKASLQMVDRIKPKIVVENVDHSPYLARHLDALERKYGRVYAINLVRAL